MKKIPLTERDRLVLALADIHEKREKMAYAGEPVDDGQDEVIVDLLAALYEPHQEHA